MTRTWILLLAAAPLALNLGCLKDTTPSDPSGDDVPIEEGESTPEGDGDGDTGDGDGDGDGDTGDGDGDGDTGDGDGDGDTGDGDGDPYPCSLPLNDPLEPTFGDPSLLQDQQCPTELGTWVKAYQTHEGNWMVGLCADGCSDCDSQQLHPLGAPNLALADIAPPDLADVNDVTLGCYFVEAESLVAEEQDRCVYGSLAIFGSDGPAALPQFVATRDDHGLPSLASQALGGWQPILDGGADCSCLEIDPEVFDCCGLYAQVFVYDLRNAMIISPPNSGSVTINGGAYTFYGQQAQKGNCDVPVEVSWALRRE